MQPDGHVNFFQDLEAGKRQDGVNAEHEEEKRKEQEEYEKKIGYLVYLGQGSLEHSHEKQWYSKIDRGKSSELSEEIERVKDLDRAAGIIGGLEEKSSSVSIEEIKLTKAKSLLDPLKDIRKYLGTPGVKRKLDKSSSTSIKSVRESSPPAAKKAKTEHSKTEKEKHKKYKHHKHKSSKKSKKHKKSSLKKKRRKSRSASDESSDGSESNDDAHKQAKLKELREARLQREREERKKAERVLAKLRGDSVSEPQQSDQSSPSKSDPSISMQRVKQKYNSQFNPHIARQNFD